MARWIDDTLVHNWFGSDSEDVVGHLELCTDKRKPQKYMFVAETSDDEFVKYYYEKPSAEEVFGSFLNWQCES